MIGDGMGVSQLTAALVVNGKLNMERMPTSGLVKTFAANAFITDSAASGTALATGHKTNKGVISMTPAGQLLETIFKHAENKGMSTGVAVTCNVTHATPASFMAHVKNRGMSEVHSKQSVGPRRSRLRTPTSVRELEIPHLGELRDVRDAGAAKELELRHAA